MANLVVMVIVIVSMVWVVSPNYVKLYTDKIVSLTATNTPHSDSSLDCALACELNYPCISYAYHPGRAQCYLYDRVIHRADHTNFDGGMQTFTSEFGNHNIALHKTTAQSSTLISSRISSLATDGIKTTSFHTDSNAWWCVDLMTVHHMKWLIIYNLFDSAAHKPRIRGFEIWLAASGGCTRAGFLASTLCHKDTIGAAQNMYTIHNCSQPNVQFDARYVFINNPTSFLHLYEVEIVPWCT